MFKDTTPEEIDKAMHEAWDAYLIYKKTSLKERNRLMHTIADLLENSGEEIIHTAMEETHLPEARLKGERARTVLQLRQYGDAAEEGSWLDLRINTADEKSNYPDVRKTKVALGPVVVFGSSNFPFAYSTAGGDTACALAAGCPVIVKAHPAHAKTSQMVADVISKAVEKVKLPKAVFTHLHGISFDVSKALVMHPLTKAVGFTGSLSGGKQLFDWGNQREEPIPVFSEMGSTNPVFLLPGKIKSGAEEIARQYAGSITNGVGQFCTKPGLIIAIDDGSVDGFKEILKEKIENTAAQKMLHAGIAKAFAQKKEKALQQKGVSVMAATTVETDISEGQPAVATVSAKEFIKNQLLRDEVFGPFSLIILCKDFKEMADVASVLKGQLTATIIGNEEEVKQHRDLCDKIENICGRFILNGVPTGVTVCTAMQHGGPFPATTDSRFTSVGSDGISRFVRPIAFQNWPNELLPEELQNENPLHFWRTVNGKMTKDAI